MIKAARDAVLALRGQHLPVNEKGEPLEAHNFNNVVVQDISYLWKNFKAEQQKKQKIIDNTVIGYRLNC